MLITATIKAGARRGVVRKTEAVCFEPFSGGKYREYPERRQCFIRKKRFYTIFWYHAAFCWKTASIKHERQMMK
jgi:hypothetical protein